MPYPCCCTATPTGPPGTCRWCNPSTIPSAMNVTLPTVKFYEAILNMAGTAYDQGSLLCTFTGGTHLCDNFFNYSAAHDAILAQWYIDHPEDVDPVFGLPQSSVYDFYALYRGCYWFGPTQECCIYDTATSLSEDQVQAVGLQPVAWLRESDATLWTYWQTVWDQNGNGPDDFFLYDRIAPYWPSDNPTPPRPFIWHLQYWGPHAQRAFTPLTITSDCRTIDESDAESGQPFDGTAGSTIHDTCRGGEEQIVIESGTIAAVAA